VSWPRGVVGPDAVRGGVAGSEATESGVQMTRPDTRHHGTEHARCVAVTAAIKPARRARQ